MNQSDKLAQDRSDDILDRAIDLIKADSSPVELKQRVIERAAAFCNDDRPSFSDLMPSRTSRRIWLILAASLSAVAAACMASLMMLPAPAVGWADVVKAVKEQKWIKTTCTFADGRIVTGWLSPERQIVADIGDSHGTLHARFFDGRQGMKYVYRMYSSQGEKIAKLLLSESEAEQTSSIDFMAGGSWTFLGEHVVSLQPHEIREDGKRWIDFDVVFWRGDDKTGILRVDPGTRLPVYLKQKTEMWTFHYPADGPADIYALGVPRTIPIEDCVPSEECQKVIRTMTASRTKIGNFRLVVVAESHGWIVWRKGDRWRIDYVHSANQSRPIMGPPDGLGWNDPFLENAGITWAGPKYICDGRAVYKSAKHSSSSLAPQLEVATGGITPRSLLSGEYGGDGNFASLVYPDLTPLYGRGFEFDPKPADAPGCVLIKRSAVGSLDGRVFYEWYYIDPVKGCAVVRVETFDLPRGAKLDPKSKPPSQTTRIENLQLSPQGFWYPDTINSAHYHFDFDPVIPDSLFVVENGKK